LSNSRPDAVTSSVSRSSNAALPHRVHGSPADCLVKAPDLTAAQESSRIVEKGRSQMNADPTNRRTDRS
jgi:hypothetical protein